MVKSICIVIISWLNNILLRINKALSSESPYIISRKELQ